MLNEKQTCYENCRPETTTKEQLIIRGPYIYLTSTLFSVSQKMCISGAIRFLENIFRFFNFFSTFLKVHLFRPFLVILSKKWCFSINWNNLKDTVLLFELCYILLQPVLTFWINFFKVLLRWLFKSLYVDIT